MGTPAGHGGRQLFLRDEILNSNNESINFMKTTMVLSVPDALKTFPMSLWVRGGNVVNAGAINALELGHFSTC